MAQMKLIDYICYPSSDSDFALVCISGYCAGTLEVILPKEATNSLSLSISIQ